MKILVGCPTYELFEYCLEEYSKAVKSLTYNNYDVLLVDNSKDNNYLKKIKSLNLPVEKCSYLNLARARIVSSMNILRDHVDSAYKAKNSVSKEFCQYTDSNAEDAVCRNRRRILDFILYRNI